MAKIEIILGPMFSGKTTELIRRLDRYKAINNNVLLINHSLDTRTTNFVKTHDNLFRNATKTNDLLSLCETDNFKKCLIIGIDESQFFNNLKQFLIICEKYNKTVILSGLDGDSNREPFGEILNCIPLCDEVIKLKALDMIDNDGSDAIFSYRHDNNNNKKIYVGAEDKYFAVSRKNYLKLNNLN